MKRKELEELREWLVDLTIVDATYTPKLKVLALTFDNGTTLLVSTNLFCKGVKK